MPICDRDYKMKNYDVVINLDRNIYGSTVFYIPIKLESKREYVNISNYVELVVSIYFFLRK